MKAELEYFPELCQQIVYEMSEGASLLQACKVMGVPVKLIRKWAANHVEFQEALEMAEEASQSWWLNEAQKAIRERDKSFPSATFSLVMKNRFGWADKQETKVDANLSLADVLTSPLLHQAHTPADTPTADDPVFDMPDDAASQTQTQNPSPNVSVH